MKSITLHNCLNDKVIDNREYLMHVRLLYKLSCCIQFSLRAGILSRVLAFIESLKFLL